MDKRDRVLQLAMPTVVVPLHGELEIPGEPGDRILVGANGMHMEVRRKWGYFVRSVSSAPETPVPFGEVTATSRLLIPLLPRQLLFDFVEHAKRNHHVEVAASIIWHELTDEFRLAIATTISANKDNIDFHVPALGTNEHLIVDCHSHANGPAFFSGQDDRDDRHATKFSFVVGNCNELKQTFVMRLCIRGLFEPFNLSLEYPGYP